MTYYGTEPMDVSGDEATPMDFSDSGAEPPMDFKEYARNQARKRARQFYEKERRRQAEAPAAEAAPAPAAAAAAPAAPAPAGACPCRNTDPAELAVDLDEYKRQKKN